MNNTDFLDKFRGNPDTLLGYIRRDPDFIAITDKYLKNKFIGIDHLLHRTEDPVVLRCIDEVSQHFKLKPEIASKIVFFSKQTSDLDMGYIPKVSNDGQYVYIRLGAKTTQKDLRTIWPMVKQHQKEVGDVGTKKWANTLLAYCIYKQVEVNGRSLKSVYADYTDGKLEGYAHKATILDINEFRRYYYSFIKGILITI